MRARLRWFRRAYLVWIAAAVSATSLALDLADERLGTTSIVVLILWVAALAIYATAYSRRRRRALEQLTGLQNGVIRYEMNHERLTIRSSLGAYTCAWPDIIELWLFDDVAVILLSKRTYTTTPMPQIDEQALEFLVERVSVHGRASDHRLARRAQAVGGSRTG